MSQRARLEAFLESGASINGFKRLEKFYRTALGRHWFDGGSQFLKDYMDEMKEYYTHDVLMVHLEEFFELTGQTMKMYDDQHHEACHGMLRKTEEIHGWKFESELSGPMKGTKLLSLA